MKKRIARGRAFSAQLHCFATDMYYYQLLTCAFCLLNLSLNQRALPSILFPLPSILFQWFWPGIRSRLPTWLTVCAWGQVLWGLAGWAGTCLHHEGEQQFHNDFLKWCINSQAGIWGEVHACSIYHVNFSYYFVVHKTYKA